MTTLASSPPASTFKALEGLSSVTHGFFGRQGGVSTGIYASLNAGPGSKDDPTAVVENRRRIASALGAAPDRLLSLHQVHSAQAVIVSAPFASNARPKADAMVTTANGVALGVLTADCAPVLLADPDAGVIAAAHAGWRGAIDGVTDAVIAAMETLGAARAAIRAAIGPCISQASYEVGPEFLERFVATDEDNRVFFKPGAGDRQHFDLTGYVAHRLGQAGIDQIEISPACTCIDEDMYFSHRRSVKRDEPDYGRNLSGIMLP